MQSEMTDHRSLGLTSGLETINVYEHVSVLDSQSVLRNDVTLCSSTMRFVLREFSFFFIVLGPEVIDFYRDVGIAAIA